MPRIEVEIDGKTYTGSYEIQGKMIEVSRGGRTKKSKLGGSASYLEPLAILMIGELVLEEKQRSGGG